MEKQRNHYIDFLRGLAAINIIIIHTAFWSGSSYVPTIVQSITLLLDVPFFFFLAGWSFSYVNSWTKNIKGIIKLQERYIFFLIIYTIILYFFAKNEVSGLNFINQIFYKRTIEPRLLPVVMSSMWFLPVYVLVSSIFSVVICVLTRKNFKNNIILLITCLLGFIYVQLGNNFLGLSKKFLFYGFFYVLGYITKEYRISSLKSLSIILIFILSFIIGSVHIFNVDITIVQKLKFPPHIVYLLISLIGISIALYFKGKIKIDKRNIINKIGQNAIFYYLGQGISSSLLYFFVNRINISWYLKLLICIIFNIVLAIIISECIHKLYGIFNCIIKKIINIGNKNSNLFFEKIESDCTNN